MYSEADVAAADVERALERRIESLQVRLSKAEDHINYLVNILNAVVEDVYGDDIPDAVTEAASKVF